MCLVDSNLLNLLISLLDLFVIILGMGLATIAPSNWTGTQKAA
jgi:hypothetical protein